MSMSVESVSKVSLLLCAQCSLIYKRVMFREPPKNFETRADKRMDQGNGKEGFVKQSVSEAGAESEAKSEAGGEKSGKPGKQPLILLWNRYQASTSSFFTTFLKYTLTLMIVIPRKLQAICGLASLPG